MSCMLDWYSDTVHDLVLWFWTLCVIGVACPGVLQQ